jgi:hypothetical protein
MTGDPSDLDPPTSDLQNLWQSQDVEYDAMTLADIHQKAGAFERKIRRRNLVEYVACVVVVAGFSPLLFRQHSWMMQVAGGMIIAAIGFVAWQLHRRASAGRTPDIGQALVGFHRAELTRQRDALRSIGLWYLAPFIPGMTMLMLGRWFQAHAPGRPVELDHLIIALSCIIVALVNGVIWLLNQRAADRLQKRIDEL